MRTTVIAGNWKLNPPRAAGRHLFGAILEGVRQRELPDSTQVAIFPPLPFLGMFAESGRPAAVRVGAQDLAVEEWGAYTGAVGGPLIREFGCDLVLVGHSERRNYFGDTDECCGRKVQAARSAGLTPVLCIGETEAERDAGETFEVLERQLRAGVGTRDEVRSGGLVLAYEPVWAIGTARTATPEIAGEAHRFTRSRLAETLGDASLAAETTILYGGSVKPENAAALLAEEDIDGALVGGASLEAESFLAILDATGSRIRT